MTQLRKSSSEDAAADLPPGSAPSFGDVPGAPFENTPERIVLSSEEHAYRVSPASLASLGGEFAHEHLGRGHLKLKETATPGEIHIQAELQPLEGPALHFDARVRGSWLARTLSADDSTPARVRVVRGLFGIAAIPSQSTVRVSVQAD